ncbi:MAG: hypothetical protein ABSH56_03255 [Bryobacteraceae bacterium]|jgi:CheY-like chemotaxis protein
MKGDESRCLAAGMDAYLPKPMQAEQLYNLLDTLGAQSSPGLAEPMLELQH